VKAVVNSIVTILHVAILQLYHAITSFGASQALLLAILVDSPHVVNSFVDCLCVGVAEKETRSYRPESHILRLEFEQR